MCLITLFKTVNCIHTQILKQIELQIKISLKQFNIFNNVDVYIYIFIEILDIQHNLGLRSKAEKKFEKREKKHLKLLKNEAFFIHPI